MSVCSSKEVLHTVYLQYEQSGALTFPDRLPSQLADHAVPLVGEHVVFTETSNQEK